MTKLKNISLVTTLACCLVACNSNTGNESKNKVAISKENEEKAIELGKWGMPLVSFFAQKEANIRDMGAQPNQILYWSQPFDHNNKILTPNDVVLYISTYIETYNGPMVLEIPPSEENIGLFGSIVDPFMVPLEDVGGKNGIDKGRGGKILITPPNYKGEIPSEYLHIPSAHYNTVAGIRITPPSFEEDDLQLAEAFIRKMKLYPYDSNDETVFVDGKNRSYDPRPPYDENFFRLIDLYVQTEAHKNIDKGFLEQMKILGIEKGEKFVSDESHYRIASIVKEDLQVGFRSVGNKFFPNSNWTTPVDPIESQPQFTYVDEEGKYYWEMRAQTWHWAIWGPKYLGGETFYLIGQKDNYGNVFSSRETYMLNVPPNVPAGQFWSVNVYEFETGGTFFDDVEKVAVSSKLPDLVTNSDGSVILTFGPECPQGMPESNHVPTVGNGSWFALFRWYAPLPELFPSSEKRWVLGDFKKYSMSIQN
jgi:hypothetical protein